MNTDICERSITLDFQSQHYMDVHLNFRRHITDQGHLMERALVEMILLEVRCCDLKRLRLASIGPGTGILDAPLVALLQEHVEVEYLGVDPNKFELDMARRRFSAAGIENYELREGIFEDLGPEYAGTFDVIIAVHVTYYSSDVRPMISKAMEMLAPEGKLMTMVSSNTPQNELFKDTTRPERGFDPVMSAEYRQLLSELGQEYTVGTLKAEIDLTAYQENPESEGSYRFLDFFLHADSRSLPEDRLRRYRRVIENQMIRDGARAILPHHVDLVIS
ncbi:methyltransferase domain superfamily [Roseibium sp. TrichSKD4]|uniref:class I SAM-dependent methyltransferase n=1 Tax=Roseibium sp. TrichSKD4 TaxID=744980 RepID=UPI0001E56B78|nr:class I SAM-dependent methyltransferase [Roseibium sp. TrichSKD4]EFO30718.1 methyltransferase domain superfamily [Roseibium sp. TrichSKD4]